jgi:hypothetical protein
MLSLNEVESTVWKAARGAGLAWGIAEEFGQAARWMAAHGLDWAQPVVTCLVEVERAKGHVSPPVLMDNTWQPAAGSAALSPVLCGPLISDLAFQLVEVGAALRFSAMAQPNLLLPFVARAAEDLAIGLSLSWAGAEWFCLGGEIRYTTLEFPPLARSVAIGSFGTGLPGALRGEPLRAAGPQRGTIGPELLERLENWVRLTYVLASAESRLAGAGAGLTDND